MLYSLRSTPLIFYFFFFNDTATTEIYTLSLHDALPICRERHPVRAPAGPGGALEAAAVRRRGRLRGRTRLCRHLAHASLPRRRGGAGAEGNPGPRPPSPGACGGAAPPPRRGGGAGIPPRGE